MAHRSHETRDPAAPRRLCITRPKCSVEGTKPQRLRFQGRNDRFHQGNMEEIEDNTWDC